MKFEIGKYYRNNKNTRILLPIALAKTYFHEKTLIVEEFRKTNSEFGMWTMYSLEWDRIDYETDYWFECSKDEWLKLKNAISVGATRKDF